MDSKVAMTFMNQLITAMTEFGRYDLAHEPVPKLMSSRDLVPIRDKLATGSRHQT